jgi:hypothetical protein
MMTRVLPAIAIAGLLLNGAAGSRGPARAEQARGRPQQPPPAPAPAPARGQADITRPTPSAAEVPILAEFDRRVKEYVALHQKAESGLPPLPTEATPQQIDATQRALFARIRAARPAAKQGDLFIPAMQTLVNARLKAIFTGPTGGSIKSSIMDENPLDTKVEVNGRYPDSIPMATMPPAILAALPQMPEELEYRFVGAALVILDPHAHLIADFIPGALPQ